MNTKPEPVSFDDYVDTYRKEIDSSIGFIGKDVDFFLQLKADKLVELAAKHFTQPGTIKVLDVGSGVGLLDKCILGNFNNLYGVDIEEGVVRKASEDNPSVNYKLYDGGTLPFPDETMDFAFAVNVMHHVPPANWRNFMNEMYRILKKGGIAAVFEHNPYNPLTRRVVNNCEFDRGAVLLKRKNLMQLFSSAGFKLAESSYIIFFPFKSRIFRSAEKIISWLPLGAQYYIAGKK